MQHKNYCIFLHVWTMLDRLKPRWWGSISHPAMHLPREPIFLEGFPTFWQPSVRSDFLIGSKWTTVSSVRENIFLQISFHPCFLCLDDDMLTMSWRIQEIRPLVDVLFLCEVCLHLVTAGWKSTHARRLMTESGTLLITRTFITRLIQLDDYTNTIFLL